jgi:hypothetical protein
MLSSFRNLSLIDAPRPPFMAQWGIKSAVNR